MKVTFNKDWWSVTESLWDISPPIPAFAAEPSLFSMSVDMALESCGGLTRRILHHMPWECDDYKEAEAAGLQPVIDVRIHRLMPGMYPAIPGWHCDRVPRANYHSQPDFREVHPLAHH